MQSGRFAIEKLKNLKIYLFLFITVTHITQNAINVFGKTRVTTRNNIIMLSLNFKLNIPN